MQARRAIDFAVAHRREAAYHLAFAVAITVLWLHAWALSLTIRPCYMGPAASPPSTIPQPSPPAIAAADNAN